MDTFSAWKLGTPAARQVGSPAARQSSGLGLANQFSGKKTFFLFLSFFPRKPEKSFN
jgi:hypothetical protein